MLPLILTTAGLIAFIGTLDGLFAAVAIDNATDGRHKTQARGRRPWHRQRRVGHVRRRSGRAVALGRARELERRRPLAHDDGVHGARCWRSCSRSAGRCSRVVPMAVVAGLMITLGFALIDNWTTGLVGRLRRKGALREPALLWSIATVVVVAFAEVFFGFMPAIGVGFQLSGLLLYLGMKRSLVRSVVDGNVRPSRRVWGGEDALRVRAARQRIRVVELEGALFFAQRRADERARRAARRCRRRRDARLPPSSP